MSIFSLNTGKHGPEKKPYLETFYVFPDINYHSFQSKSASQSFDFLCKKNVLRTFQKVPTCLWIIRKIFPKKQHFLLLTCVCTYQEERNVTFSENFAYALNE